jgi:predicted Fe-Mo cluster-binding NifX family protein
MKTAIASDDGKTIAAHFGHCAGFLVLTVEDGKVVHREVRKAAGKPTRHEHPHDHQRDSCECLTKPAAGHQSRLALIEDCAAAICLGMGPRAADALEAAGIQPVVLPGPMEPDEAALAYAKGRVPASMPGAGCRCHDSP